MDVEAWCSENETKKIEWRRPPLSTLLISHPCFVRHQTPPGHPERPDRIRAVERILEHERFMALEREASPLAAVETLILAHPESYVRAIEEAAPREGMVQIDADTTMSEGTWEAALRAVGGAVLAVDEVVSGKVRNAFAAARPPGHHAESSTAMGFCFFNNAAIAARHAQKVHGLERVAIVDWDVHHGNGTQEIFWADKSVMYCSTHEMPLYPGTGAAHERGEHGTIVNVPLRAGDGGAEFREAFEVGIIPRLEEFRPDLVIISAGFDAHLRDPLANLNLVEADFAWATTQLMDIADRFGNGRVVSLLEGGYDLEGLARSTAAHVMTLMRAG
jgi:acetoin utilization deacetylase AcuC-like enzyme